MIRDPASVNTATLEVSLACPAVSADLRNVKHMPSSPGWFLGENLLVRHTAQGWQIVLGLDGFW